MTPAVGTFLLLRCRQNDAGEDSIFRDVTLCNWVSCYSGLIGPDDGGNSILRNVWYFSSQNTDSHPTRLKCLQLRQIKKCKGSAKRLHYYNAQNSGLLEQEAAVTATGNDVSVLRQGMLQSCSTDRPTAINLLKPAGHVMHQQLNIQQLSVLPTQCIYVFCIYLKTNSDYFPIKH